MTGTQRRTRARRRFSRTIFFALGALALLVYLGARWVPGAFEALREPEPDYLTLVNWTHPIEEPARRLKRLSSLLNGVAAARQSDMLVNERAGLAARELFEAAAKDGLDGFIVASAYRSTERQAQLWKNKLASDPDYGKDPFVRPVSVMPSNASEHSTGLALDIVCRAFNELEEGFASTEESAWLHRNAHRFGFVMRYPADKEHVTGVVFEPWHYRYVGVEAATRMVEEGLCLEEYLAGSVA